MLLFEDRFCDAFGYELDEVGFVSCFAFWLSLQPSERPDLLL